MKKKIIALASVLVLLVSLIPVSALATKIDYDNTYELSSWSNSKTLVFDSGSFTTVYFNIKNLSSGSFATKAFCADLDMSTAIGTKYEAYTLEDTGALNGRLGGNASRVRAIILAALTSGGSINTGALKGGAGLDSLTDEQAIWGTQAALWKLIEGKNFVYVGGEPSDGTGANTVKVKAVYDYLLSLPGASGFSSITDTAVEIADTVSSYELSSDGTMMHLTYDITSTNVESINFTLTNAPAGSTISGDKDHAVVSVPVGAFYTADTVAIEFKADVTGPTYHDAVVFIPEGNASKQILVGRISVQNKDSDSVSDSFTDPGSAKFKLTKTSEDTGLPLAGIKFVLEGPIGHPDYEVKELITDENGVVEFTGLFAGQYKLTEPSPLPGYITTGFVIEGNIVGDLSIDLPPTYEDNDNPIANRAIPASIKLLKWSTFTDTALVGAQFELYDGATKVAGPVTSDANGVVSFTNLYPGEGKEYTLKEVQAPTGYAAAADMTLPTLVRGQDLDLTSNADYRIDNDILPVSILVKKLDDYYNTMLSGAEFKLYLGALVDGLPQGDAISTKTTGSSGTVTFSDLTPGQTYVVQESNPPTGYESGTPALREVVVEQPGQELTVNYRNQPKLSSFRVTKTFDGSNMPSYFDDVTFTLTGPYINAQSQTAVPNYPAQVINPASKSNGVFTFEGLVYGEYILKETATSTAATDFEAMSDRVVTIGIDTSSSVSVDNKSVKGAFVIRKSVADTYEGDPYAPLEGIEFTVYSDSALTNSVDTLTTGANGQAVSKQLAPGTYYVKETSAPSVYETNSTVYEVTIKYKSQRTSEYELINVENVKKEADFALIKRSTYDDALLQGAEFTLTAVFDPSIAYTLTTDANGYAQVLDVTPGQYVMVETKAPIGFNKIADMDGDGTDDPDGILVEIAPGRTTQSEYVLTLYNQPQYANAVVAKFARGDRTTRLQGVRFGLYKNSVTVANKIGSSQITDQNGNVAWSGLTPGTYILVEEATIPGYVMPTNPNTTFTLAGGEYKVIILENDPTPTTSTPTPTPPTNPPESTPPTTPSATPTSTPTATPTPIETDEFEIEDVDPAFGPETGEGTTLLIFAGLFVLLGVALLVVRKKLIHK